VSRPFDIDSDFPTVETRNHVRFYLPSKRVVFATIQKQFS